MANMQLCLHPNQNDFILTAANMQVVISRLTLTLTLDGVKHPLKAWKSAGDRCWKSASPAGEVTLQTQPCGKALEMQLHGISTTTRNHRFGGFAWEYQSDADDFGTRPGAELRLFREGWTMASAMGSSRYGELAYECDPGYLQFAVSNPKTYECTKPSRFFGEYLLMLNHAPSRETLLAGFVTSADQIGQCEVELQENGLKTLILRSAGDDILLEPGDTFQSERAYWDFGTDVPQMLELFAARWGEAMHSRKRRAIAPNGWCSWYYYFEHVTEADILENIAYLGQHREEYPLEYLQIDDGYQAALGDWLTTKKEFPHGLPFIAGKISEIGMKPGLWLAPFMVEERSALCAQHPDWMVQSAEGGIAWTTTWRNCRVAVLDGTNPAVQEHFRMLFRTLADFGFVYVKLDFMVFAAAAPNGVYFDPKATRAQALRRGLSAIREGFGDDHFILGCTVPLGPVVGLVDAERISTDITPYWQNPESEHIYAEAPTVPNVCRNVIFRRYLHKHLFFNDPDVHIARRDNNKLTENEIRLWTAALYLAGGLTLLTDRFESLDADRAALSKLLLEEPDRFDAVRPVDLFDREVPAIWAGKFHRNGKSAFGVFNFGEQPETYTVLRSELPGSGQNFREYWTGETVAAQNAALTLTVAPHSVKLFLAE